MCGQHPAMLRAYLESCVVLIAAQLHLAESAACQKDNAGSLTWMKVDCCPDDTKTTTQVVRCVGFTVCVRLCVLLVEVQSLCEPF